MDVKEYTRKTFSVNAVELSLENYKEVAEWCGGTVEMVPTRLIGVLTKLPVVKIANNKGQDFVASLGCYVVELKGSFRVYKPVQFNDSFDEKEEEYPRFEPTLQKNCVPTTSDLAVYDETSLKLVSGDNT